MSSWFAAHGIAFARSLSRLIRHPFSAFFEVFVLGIALSLPVSLFVVIDMARGFASQHPNDPEMSVFLTLGSSAQTVEALRKKLRAIPDVQTVTYVARQDAAKNLRKSAGLAEVLDALPDNPLPDAFTLKLKTQDAARMDSLKADISKWPNVAVVQADSGWARKMETGLRVAQSAALLLGVLFGIAAVTVTFNTVRLQMLGRREEIQLSRLIGATNAFIRRPYLWFGALQGFLGGTAALGIVVAALSALEQPIGDFSIAYGMTIALQMPSTRHLAGFLAATTLLGALAAWIAASRHLRASHTRGA
jgi:cell division transport system permease protein